MAYYPPPRVIQSIFNKDDFLSKEKTAMMAYPKIKVPAVDEGVVSYRSTDKYLRTYPGFVFKSETQRLGIDTSNPLTKLSINPLVGVEPKITLYDAGNTLNHMGLSVSNYQMNYNIDVNSSSHVFYCGGKNNEGLELVRFSGNRHSIFSGLVSIGPDTVPLTRLSLNPLINEPKISLYDNNDLSNYTGIGVSNNGDMNYTLINNTKDYVFWTGGKNTIGSTELVRIKGNGNTFLKGSLETNNKINIILPSTFPSFLATGGNTNTFGLAKDYPFCIYAQTGTVGQRRTAIAFCDNATNSNDVPAFDISYVRRNAGFDQGDLQFNSIVTNASANITRAHIMTLNNSMIYTNRPLTLGNLAFSVTTYPTVNQAMININTNNTNETKICLYDAATAGTMMGMSCSSNAFNFQVRSASDVYSFRSGGLNGDGTEILRLQATRILGQFPVSITQSSLGEKLCLYDNGTTSMVGLSLSTGQLNFHANPTDDFVFYNGGRTGPGAGVTELVRISKTGYVGIGTTTPNTLLSITPSSEGAKITLYDGGGTTAHYGFGISAYTLNYDVDSYYGNHVFWAGGKNGVGGTELFRIRGNKSCECAGNLQVIDSAYIWQKLGVGVTSDLWANLLVNGRQALYSSVYPLLVTTGTSPSLSNTYPLQFMNPYTNTGSYLGICFAHSNNNYATVPGATIDYNRTDTTYDIGNINFALTTNGATNLRENILSIQPTQVLATKLLTTNDKINIVLPSTFSQLLCTGTAIPSGFTTAKNFPLCIYARSAITTERKAGISFADNASNANDIPAVDLTYFRTNTSFDSGRLEINMTESYSTNVTRVNVANFTNSLIYFNKPLTLANSASGIIPNLNQSRININTSVFESKMCLYDAGTAGSMCGMGVDTNTFAFQIPSTAYSYSFRYGGTNNNGTELIKIKGDLTTNFNGSVCIGSTVSPLTKLSISPNATEAKLTFYDGGSTSNHYGIGVTSGQLNYHVDAGSASHVFYATGKNGNGTELFKIQGDKNCKSAGNFTIKESINQAALNINTNNTNETKICLYDALTTNTMMGIGVSTNLFNFQLRSTADAYTWRYGGINGNGTEMMRLSYMTALGNLTTTPGPALGIGMTPTHQLSLFTNSAYKPASTTWVTTSDERIKEDITDASLEKCYENIKSLPLKRFRWKNEVYSDEQINDRNVLGWIAQDVEQIFPKSVTKSNLHGYDDLRTLDVDEINKSHYGATQKLMQKVESLESIVETLMNKINYLQNELNILKK